MVTEKVIEEISNAVQREAGKRNLVLNVGATRSGWAIRLRKGDKEAGTADSFYCRGGCPDDFEVYDTAKDAYDAMLREKVQPCLDAETGKYEMPSIVYAQAVVITTEEEVG